MRSWCPECVLGLFPRAVRVGGIKQTTVEVPWDPHATVSCQYGTLGITGLDWGGRGSWICGTGEGCRLGPIVGYAPQEDRDTAGGTGHSPGPPATQSSLPVVSGWSWQDASARVPGPDLPQDLLPPTPGSHMHTHTHAHTSPWAHTPTCQRQMGEGRTFQVSSSVG